MANIIIVAAIVVIFAFALKKSIGHFKGNAVCCGGDSAPVKVKKKKLDKVAAEKTMKIEGMTCGNCSTRVENALNRMENVRASVNLRKKEAKIIMSENIADEELIRTVEKEGYKVTGIN